MDLAGLNKERVQEALNLLQEECGEVVVEVSKCRRFGLDGVHAKTFRKHRDELALEIADVLSLVDVLIAQGAVSEEKITEFKLAKIEKLRTWTTLFKD